MRRPWKISVAMIIVSFTVIAMMTRAVAGEPVGCLRLETATYDIGDIEFPDQIIDLQTGEVSPQIEVTDPPFPTADVIYSPDRRSVLFFTIDPDATQMAIDQGRYSMLMLWIDWYRPHTTPKVVLRGLPQRDDFNVDAEWVNSGSAFLVAWNLLPGAGYRVQDILAEQSSPSVIALERHIAKFTAKGDLIVKWDNYVPLVLDGDPHSEQTKRLKSRLYNYGSRVGSISQSLVSISSYSRYEIRSNESFDLVAGPYYTVDYACIRYYESYYESCSNFDFTGQTLIFIERGSPPQLAITNLKTGQIIRRPLPIEDSPHVLLNWSPDQRFISAAQYVDGGYRLTLTIFDREGKLISTVPNMMTEAATAYPLFLWSLDSQLIAYLHWPEPNSEPVLRVMDIASGNYLTLKKSATLGSGSPEGEDFPAAINDGFLFFTTEDDNTVTRFIKSDPFQMITVPFPGLAQQSGQPFVRQLDAQIVVVATPSQIVWGNPQIGKWQQIDSISAVAIEDRAYSKRRIFYTKEEDNETTLYLDYLDGQAPKKLFRSTAAFRADQLQFSPDHMYAVQPLLAPAGFKSLLLLNLETLDTTIIPVTGEVQWAHDGRSFLVIRHQHDSDGTIVGTTLFQYSTSMDLLFTREIKLPFLFRPHTITWERCAKR